MLKEAAFKCPICKEKAQKRHCRSPYCNWYMCFNHADFYSLTFMVGRYFIVLKEPKE